MFIEGPVIEKVLARGAEVRMKRRISRKSTVVAFLAPWMAVAVAVGVVAASTPATAGAATRHQSSARHVAASKEDSAGDFTWQDPPTFQVAENGTLNESTAGTLDSDVTDSDGTATCCTVTLGSQASNGTASVNPDGSFTYTPNSGFIGTDSFGYVINDTDGNTASGTANIDVTTGTTTRFTDTGTPPAGSPSTKVTFSVEVTANNSGGPAPTGTVTFSWMKTNGAPRVQTGTIGTVPLTNGSATITSTLPLGGQGGQLNITATYSGDAVNNTSYAQTIYYVIDGCHTGSWGPEVHGQTVPVADTSPEGYYIGDSNGFFTVYVVNNPNKKTKFTGSVSTDGPLIDIAALKSEGQDWYTLRDTKTSSEIGFKMTDNGYVTGFTFFPACGHSLDFELQINGKNAKASQIFLGSSDQNPSDVPMTAERKN